MERLKRIRQRSRALSESVLSSARTAATQFRSSRPTQSSFAPQSASDGEPLIWDNGDPPVTPAEAQKRFIEVHKDVSPRHKKTTFSRHRNSSEVRRSQSALTGCSGESRLRATAKPVAERRKDSRFLRPPTHRHPVSTGGTTPIESLSAIYDSYLNAESLSDSEERDQRRKSSSSGSQYSRDDQAEGFVSRGASWPVPPFGRSNTYQTPPSLPPPTGPLPSVPLSTRASDPPIVAQEDSRRKIPDSFLNFEDSDSLAKPLAPLSRRAEKIYGR